MMIIFFSGNRHKAREIEAIFTPFSVRLYTDFMEKFEVVECGKSFAENAKIKLLALKNAFELLDYESIFGKKGEKIILMAEDSGICVESLDNMPSIFSARFANLPPLRHCEVLQNVEAIQNVKADSSDKDNITRLISELKARDLRKSKACFVSCVTCCKLGNSLCGNLSLDKHSADSKIFDEIVPQRKSANEAYLSVRRSEADLRRGAISQKDEFVKILTTHGFLNGKVICTIRGDNGFGYDPIFIPNGFSKTLGELSSEAKNTLSHRKNALDLMRLLLQ